MTGPRVDVPADVAVEDRVAGPLTFRHLGYLSVAAAGAALGVLGGTTADWAAGAPLLLLGAAGAGFRPGGRPIDAWVRPLAGYLRRRPAPRAPAPTRLRRPVRRRWLAATAVLVGVGAAGVAAGQATEVSHVTVVVTGATAR